MSLSYSSLKLKNFTRFQLTQKGIESYRKTMKLDTIRTIMSVLSEEEREILNTCFEKLWYKALKELNLPDRPPVLLHLSNYANNGNIEGIK